MIKCQNLAENFVRNSIFKLFAFLWEVGEGDFCDPLFFPIGYNYTVFQLKITVGVYACLTIYHFFFALAIFSSSFFLSDSLNYHCPSTRAEHASIDFHGL